MSLGEGLAFPGPKSGTSTPRTWGTHKGAVGEKDGCGQERAEGGGLAEERGWDADVAEGEGAEKADEG